MATDFLRLSLPSGSLLVSTTLTADERIMAASRWAARESTLRCNYIRLIASESWFTTTSSLEPPQFAVDSKQTIVTYNGAIMLHEEALVLAGDPVTASLTNISYPWDLDQGSYAIAHKFFKVGFGGATNNVDALRKSWEMRERDLKAETAAKCEVSWFGRWQYTIVDWKMLSSRTDHKTVVSCYGRTMYYGEAIHYSNMVHALLLKSVNPTPLFRTAPIITGFGNKKELEKHRQRLYEKLRPCLHDTPMEANDKRLEALCHGFTY